MEKTGRWRASEERGLMREVKGSGAGLLCSGNTNAPRMPVMRLEEDPQNLPVGKVGTTLSCKRFTMDGLHYRSTYFLRQQLRPQRFRLIQGFRRNAASEFPLRLLKFVSDSPCRIVFTNHPLDTLSFKERPNEDNLFYAAGEHSRFANVDEVPDRLGRCVQI